MTLETVYYIGQLVSVIVIIATLLALFYQVHQANQIARSELSHGQLLSGHGLLGPTIATNPEYAEFLVRVLESDALLEPTDRLRFLNFMHSLVIIFGSAQTLKSKGLIEAQMFQDSASAVSWWMSFERSRKWWQSARSAYRKDVCIAIDGLLVSDMTNDKSAP
ncbi:MAG: hypothetical protein AAGF33_10770 [Pseudomonadota bacterium]